MKKLAIFDLDGTLLNTIADLAAATNYALVEQGLPTHETEAYKNFVGNGINKLFERALPAPERTQKMILKTRSLFVPYYDAHNADFSKPYEGIPELLTTLQNKEMKLAVASNKYQAATSKLIEHYFPNIHFQSVYGQRDEIPSKPDPTVIHKIAATAQIQMTDLIYIGDSHVDMKTGRNAGVCTVGVSWGFRPRKELESYQPDFIADTPEELLQYLLSNKD